MAFKFDDDINWIFTFCKKCWDFKKFVFSEVLDFEKSDSSKGVCVSCKKEQIINLQDAKNYYDHLNDNNN